MTFVPMMWAVWGALVACLAGLYVYRMSLTRDEDDQLVLDDSFDNVRNQQAAIVAKVHRMEPLLRVCLGLVCAMTAVVLVYYGYDVLSQLGLIGHS